MFLINVFVLIFYFGSIHGEDELLAVTLLFRHGDRPPLYFYPNDPYQDPALWPVPPGELTNIGKLQHFIFGKWLRNRYSEFLSPIYNNSDIYIRSSDMNRCIMSAAANVAGFYPPQGKDIWEKELLWQPIPIHTVPIEEDDIAEISDACPKYKKLKEEARRNSTYFRSLNEKYKEVYQFLTEKTGKLISDIQDTYDLYDILFIESLYNFTLPDWTHEVYPQLIEIGDIAPKLFSLNSQLARLFAGRFLDHVVSQFQHFSSFQSHMLKGSNYKFKVFSAHDDQVYGILNALNVQNLKKVPYAAGIIFELRRSKEDLYVQVLYKTKIDTAEIVQIGGCDLKCKLTEFGLILQTLTLSEDQFKTECNE